MKSATKNILAIAPGRREFGVVVFCGNELTYFAVRNLQNRHSEKLLKNEVGKLVRRMIAFSQPEIIAVKAVSQYQKPSATLKVIVRIIKQQAAVNQILVAEISLNEIKAALCDDEKPMQKKAFQKLAAMYPELRQFSNCSTRWQTEYYHNLFAAVAVGVVCFKSLSKR
jgi:hypothetical protein